MVRLSIMLLTILLTGLVLVNSAYTDASGKEDETESGFARYINSESCGGIRAPWKSSADLSVDNSTHSHPEKIDRIIGGRTSTSKWPWMASLSYSGKHECGGTVIDERHVISAAHCFKGKRKYARGWRVMVGELNHKHGHAVNSFYKVDEIIVHKDYTGDPDHFNDIAIVRLTTTLPRTFIPACLPSRNDLLEGNRLTRLCWGSLFKGSIYPIDLREVRGLEMISSANCRKVRWTLNPFAKDLMEKQQFCTRYPEGGKRICESDAGGPVMKQNACGQYVLEGVVSYSNRCARVYSYINWIQENTKKRCGIRAPWKSSADLSVGNLTQSDDDKIHRIIGGHTSISKWPWMATLAFKRVHQCTGTVIDERHVIAAAHCFMGKRKDAREWRVDVGELNSLHGYMNTMRVDCIKIHEKFSGSPDWFNDIAIVRLVTPLPCTFMPACLPTRNDLLEGNRLTILGWGELSKGGKYPDDLQESHDLEMISTAFCRKIIKRVDHKRNNLMENQFCIGGPVGGKGHCKGDSGGLVMKQNHFGQYVLEGVVSYSYGCARRDISGVYARVYSYINWIQRCVDEKEWGFKYSIEKDDLNEKRAEGDEEEMEDEDNNIVEGNEEEARGEYRQLDEGGEHRK